MSELVDVSVKAVAWLAGLALLACVLQVGAYVRAARRPSRPLARATRRPKFGVIMSVRGGDEALLDALRSLHAAFERQDEAKVRELLFELVALSAD